MLSIDRYASTPVYQQLVEQFIRCIAAGIYRPGEMLPSVRSLSARLNINPNTLQKAYGELENRGLCCCAPGNGRYVSQDATDKLTQAAQKELQAFERQARCLLEAGVPYETLLTSLNDLYKRS